MTVKAGCYFLFAANVTIMKLVKTVYKYLVDNIGSPFGQIMSNCLYLHKKLYRDDNVSSINYYNYSFFVINRTQRFWLDDEEKLRSILWLITSEDVKEELIIVVV